VLFKSKPHIILDTIEDYGGKTTLMLQKIKKSKGVKPLYVTAEHPYFYNHTLYEVASSFYKMGGRSLFIDEAHKYPRWSRELKVIYDGFPDLNIVFSASSALDIYKGEADLSRRAITYQLPGLSFREYLHFTNIKSIDAIELADLLKNHQDITSTFTDGVMILPLFKKYLQTGYLPVLLESSGKNYLVRLTQMINAVIDADLAYSLIDQPEVGSLRETFLLNQLLNAGHEVKAPHKGDLLVDGNVLLEIGGKNKGKKQIMHADEAFIAADDIEHGFGRKIPLWLFGFLY